MNYKKKKSGIAIKKISIDLKVVVLFAIAEIISVTNKNVRPKILKKRYISILIAT